MNRQARPPSAFSKVSVKSPTVIPREVRERLDLKPGDTLRYRVTEDGVLLDKAPQREVDDPFGAFSEWSGDADEKAYGDLWEHKSHGVMAGLVPGMTEKHYAPFDIVVVPFPDRSSM
ncbi:MAG: AbrB/MazE/SpoVT family DNA-binding domain-containing protein [Stellaceae bacterium]